MSYMDRLDPNLAVKLHYASKAMWILLAGVFGLIGYKLYALGITQTGGAEVGIPGILTFSLKDAGPGLVVMIVALACAVVGTIRSKVTFTPELMELTAPSPSSSPTEDKRSHQSKRECRLFGRLVEKLGKGPSAYAILNSESDVDIESMGWSQLPSEVRMTAVDMASRLISSDRIETVRRETLRDCVLDIGIITVDDTRWGLISVKPRDQTLLRSIAHECTRPICHWD